ncbi:NAD(P)-binding protein [Aspergillus sclerotioniger CBS 115572]|uniref:NAD(P)-binding protein n=1 Tax=Aspergillus sclerotioniger CBS 115572 TaxID=1450535 RepID=A0A317XGQ2_9EURO|nr:NAD(P)-binding protein [Aspergillus sclerotioniger CBS 115572]PWY96140.1 NAD(P)-binding protein [Aspergillus sclerotioniger CBS 115572]
MLVAVLPASPKTAQETIRVLLEADQLTSPVGVHAIYRDLSKAPREFCAHAGFHAVAGDLNDATSLDLGGADTVFAITPPRYDGSDMMQWATIASENTRLAIQKAGSVKRLVLLSSMGAEQPSGTGEILTNHIAEEILKDVVPEIIFMRCAYFMENWAPAVLTVKSDQPHFDSPITPLDYEIPMVAVTDIGKACATYLMAIHIPKHPYVIEVQGPQDHTVKDVQKAFEEAAGHAVEVRPVEKARLATFFGQFLPDASVGPFVEMTISFLPGGILARKADNNSSKDVRLYRGRTDLGEAIGRMYRSL